MKVRLSYVLGAVGVVIAILFAYSMTSPYRISPVEAKRRLSLGQFDVVLDVRTAAERDLIGSYPGSVHIPGAELEKEFPPKFPNKEVRVLVYCNTGQRARRATETLHALGYPNVVYIAGSHLTLLPMS